MKAYYLILGGIYFAARNRYVQAVAGLVVCWWLWGLFSSRQEAEVEEAFVEQAILEIESSGEIATAPVSEVMATVNADDKAPSRRGKVDEPLFFSPGYTEAVVGRFHQKHGRLPASWTELKDAKVVGDVPEARPGHKIVYDAELGMIEEVPEAEASGRGQ